MRTDK